MSDQCGQLWAPWDLSGYDLASQQSVGASQGHSGTVRTTSGQYEYKLVYFRTAFCFANIAIEVLSSSCSFLGETPVL